MDIRLLYDSETFKLHVLPEYRALQTTLIGVLYSEEYREGLLTMLGAQQAALEAGELPLSVLIMDLRAFSAVHPEDAEWVNDVVVPKFRALGGTRAFGVLPEDFFAEFQATDRIHSLLNRGIPTVQAESLEQVYALLRAETAERKPVAE